MTKTALNREFQINVMLSSDLVFERVAAFLQVFSHSDMLPVVYYLTAVGYRAAHRSRGDASSSVLLKLQLQYSACCWVVCVCQ